jgi:hypothetical protein
LNQSAKPHLNEVIVMVAIEAKKFTIQLLVNPENSYNVKVFFLIKFGGFKF